MSDDGIILNDACVRCRKEAVSTVLGIQGSFNWLVVGLTNVLGRDEDEVEQMVGMLIREGDLTPRPKPGTEGAYGRGKVARTVEMWYHSLFALCEDCAALAGVKVGQRATGGGPTYVQPLDLPDEEPRNR